MLTTHTAVQHVTTTSKENDSPAIVREGGVEEQSTTERLTRIMDSETNTGQAQRIMDNDDDDDTLDMEIETNLGLSQRTTETHNNYTCTQCRRSFGTMRGLKIHQGRKCMKKKQCGSLDRKTRNRPAQESNHSSRVLVTAKPSMQEATTILKKAERKPKVAWPAANDKASYRKFEETVCKKIYKIKGTVQERLKNLANTIYETGKEQFGEESAKKKTVSKGGKSRRERKMEEIRKEKNDLRKRWRRAKPDEKKGLSILYEKIKEKCRNMERNIRRNERRKESKRTREQFIKNPYAVTKKMFTESKSGKLKCTKEELDKHISDTYSDPQRDEPLPPMSGLKHPTAPGIKFQLGAIKEKEVDNFVRKTRAKSAPGGDRVSYKVYKYCDRLRHKLFF